MSSSPIIRDQMLSLIIMALGQLYAPTEDAFSPPQHVIIRRTDGRVVDCIASKIASGPEERIGKWIIHRELGDPYGFGPMINNFRTRNGRQALVYDQQLTTWATENNQWCNRFGMGHWRTHNCWQNVGWNYPSVTAVFNGWLNSPAHKIGMLSSTTRYGISYGPGPYWTLNMR